MRLLVLLTFVSSLMLVPASIESDLLLRVNRSLLVTEDILADMFDKWQLNKYPNFLQSAAMTHTSWEVLKLKYQIRILDAAKKSFPGSDKFVISFMGSSVTAGHDSPFNVSFPILTGKNMAPAFEALGIQLESRNAAMGNNPCMPYDVCVRTFAGADADIVHWEQSFNCFISEDDVAVKSLFEQFVRQSLVLPKQPVIVFSQSDTPNWEAKDCDSARRAHALTAEENELLDALHNQPMDIATKLNKHEVGKWNVLLDVLKAYKTAGIQVFSHTHYEVYKCQGPYDQDWGCCSASWHPSLKGHEIRAAHYSFFWLLVLKEALKEIATRLGALSDTVDMMLEEVEKHVLKEHQYIPTSPLYPTNVSDSVQCFTNFEPRYQEGTDIGALIVPNGHGWKKAIFEEFLDKSIISKARSRGYLDYKYMHYGDKSAGPLSINILTRQKGFVFICQTPGNWGKLPGSFKNFWEADTQVFLETRAHVWTDYRFNTSAARELRYFIDKPQDSQRVCVQCEEEVEEGAHVLTIVPGREAARIILSVLLLP